MKVISTIQPGSELAAWLEKHADINSDDIQTGEDVVIVQRHQGRILIARGRVYGSDKEAIKNLRDRAKRSATTAPPTGHLPFNDEAVKICRWFYGQQGREKPTGRDALQKVLNEVRLVMQEDMSDTPDAKRSERLMRVLASALGNDFWSRQIISLGGIRKKGSNDRPKWKNAETALQESVGGAQYRSGDMSWKEKYRD